MEIEMREMLAAAQAGREEAVEEILLAYEPLMRSVVKQYVFFDMEAEDFLQECRLVTIRAIQHFQLKREVAFATYLRQCLRNACVELLRKQAGKRHIPLSQMVYDAKTLIENQHRSHDPVGEVVLLKEETADYLLRLSDFEKQVLYQYVQGKDSHLIAQDLDTDCQRVTNALTRCRRKYKSIYEDPKPGKDAYKRRPKKSQSLGQEC